MLFLVALLLFFNPAFVLSCPDGTIAAFTGDFCWYFVTNSLDFINAEKYCRNYDGHLSSIHNAFDNIYLADKAKTIFGQADTFFVGGSNLQGGGNNWTWIDGTQFSFVDWAPGEPSNPSLQSCLQIDVGHALWKAADCFLRAPFVCSISSNITIPTTQQPIITTTNLNIPTPSSSNSSKYQIAANYFTQTLDTTQDPCENFYEYVCGNNNPNIVNVGGMDYASTEDYNDLHAGYTKQNPGDSLPVKLLKHSYTVCQQNMANWNNVTSSGLILSNIVQRFANVSAFPFPLVDHSSASWPTANVLGTAMGFLSGVYQVDTLLSFFVDTNWKNNQGPNPFLLYLDQPVLTLSWTYYIGTTWDLTRPSLYKYIKEAFMVYAGIKNIQLDSTQLDLDINAILDFEHLLANNYSSDATTRLQQSRNYNPFTKANFSQKYDILDSTAYFNQLATNDFTNTLAQKMRQDSYLFIVAEPDRLNDLQNAIHSNQLGSRTLYNYFYFRVLFANSLYYPTTFKIAKSKSDIEIVEKLIYKKPIHGRPTFVEKKPLLKTTGKDLTDIQISCLDDSLNNFDMASSRVFIDQIYPMPADKQAIKTHGGQVASTIILGMRSMIDGLTWMTDSTRSSAYAKLNNLIKNIAYPDFITDDVKLTDYYKYLNNFENVTQYSFILQELQVFAIGRSLDQLLSTTAVDRTAFNGPSAIANAWYQPQLNSITLPAGFLRQPVYDYGFPWSLIFGSIGIVTGHEVTHGFDSSGTQWDSTGNLNPWMDSQSQTSFNNMAQCVIDEYNQFCPLNASVFTPNCINGFQTQGENIADNGGIHAAFRAYKTAVDVNGADPRLPGLMSQFTHDQIFFMSFGKILCIPVPNPNREYIQILVDPHSPAKYRVFGSLRNYPAFRNAFNCKAGDAYTPTNHCNVWVSPVGS